MGVSAAGEKGETPVVENNLTSTENRYLTLRPFTLLIKRDIVYLVHLSFNHTYTF